MVELLDFICKWYFTMKMKKPDSTCVLIFTTRGLPAHIADACGITRQAVYQWKQVPPHWVQIVADIVKMRPEEIRPDIFRPRKGSKHR